MDLDVGPFSTSSAPNAEPRVAVMTMVRDEAEMLPRWLAYYGEQFGLESLVLIDDSSTDGSTDNPLCTVLRMPAAPWKQNWMRTRTDLVNGLSRGLLACFDVVIFTDVDEFLIPDPQVYKGLNEYVATRVDTRVMAPLALNVLHHKGQEAPLRSDQKVLEQRRFVKFVPGMCKPLIIRTAVPWMMGFHGIRAPFQIDPELLLIHLKYFDNDALVDVAERRRELHVNEGRGAPVSSWALGAQEIQRRLACWVGSGPADAVPELDPRDIDVSGVVQRRPNGFFRSVGQSLVAMENNPLYRLPERFRGIV